VHILTKVFVVLATVLALFLAALVVPLAVNAGRIEQSIADEKARLAAAEAAGATAQAAWNTEKLQTAERMQSLQNQLSELQGQINRLQGESSQMLVERNRAVADRVASEAKIDELTQLSKTQAGIISGYRDEIGKLRDNELTYRQRALEMEQRLSDIESQRDVLDQNYRALREELAAYKQDAAASNAGAVSGGTGRDQPFNYAGALIRGTVQEVQREPSSGKTLVRLSVGTNDRVQKNMIMRVVRGNVYVGNVTITGVDLSHSVGEVTLLSQGQEVRNGDTVQSSLR